MAKLGNHKHGWLADSTKRVSVEGKNALIMEVVTVVPSSATVTLYNRNMTAYTGTPTDITTGAAILKHIKHIAYIGVGFNVVGGGVATTTTQLFSNYKIVNGPTTAGIVHVHTNSTISQIRLLVVGMQS